MIPPSLRDAPPKKEAGAIITASYTTQGAINPLWWFPNVLLQHKNIRTIRNTRHFKDASKKLSACLWLAWVNVDCC